MAKKKLIKQLIFTFLILTLSICILLPVIKNTKLGLDLQGGYEILYKVKSIDGKSEVTSDMVTSTYKTMLRRIDGLGVTEPTISIEGSNIRVALAGITNADEARKVLSQTASLTFRDTNDNLLMDSSVLKSGGAKVGQSENGKPAVVLSVKDKDKFYKNTKKVSEMNDNRIVIWLDYDEENSFAEEEKNCGSLNKSNCISVAGVSQGFSSDVTIQGNFDEKQAIKLVELINSGSMPTKLEEISSNSVEASLGKDSLEKTAIAGITAILLIITMLIFIYKFSGFIASVGAIIYTALTFFTFWLIGGTLSLSSIAAMIIGVGMAVDSNVINFERIKDELYEGNTIRKAFKKGNKSSFLTIIDANITTLIVAIVLFIFGQSSIKGFATMLIISVITTLFVMLFFTRWLLKKFVNTGYFDKKPKMFIGVDYKNIPKKGEKRIKYSFKDVDFVKIRKIFIVPMILLIIIGGIFTFKDGLKFGLDFKGGTAITINTNKKITEEEIKKDTSSFGFNVYEFKKQTKDIYVAKLSQTISNKKSKDIQKYLKDKYDAKVDVGVISETVKNETIKNAVISLALALIIIIFYISFRFKFSYGISSIIALITNVLVIIAFFAIFKFEISNIFIAAILSIIGYSVNDVIITFDRIRETHNKYPNKNQLEKVVNESLQSISMRSIITSITTLIAVVCLLVLGSKEIVTFYIAMIVGLVSGLFTSLFIATQIWLEINKKTNKKKPTKNIDEDEPEEILIKGINS